MTATNPPPAAAAGTPAARLQPTVPAAAHRRSWRLLPIMAARWVFNGGTALALALGLVE